MKNYIVFQLGLSTRCGYNESTQEFEWLSTENATRYTEKEAEEKRDELLSPMIEEYQRTGKGYKEIHFGKII